MCICLHVGGIFIYCCSSLDKRSIRDNRYWVSIKNMVETCAPSVKSAGQCEDLIRLAQTGHLPVLEGCAFTVLSCSGLGGFLPHRGSVQSELEKMYRLSL